MPSFAERLPGRTALLVWGEDELPADLRRLATAAARLGLREFENQDAIAYCSPESLEVGWADLAASIPFRRAIAQLPASSTHVVYLDLQQIIESAMRREGSARAELEQGARVLSLSGLQSAIVGMTREAGGWRGRGVIVTTGVQAGLPGLLTSEVSGRTHAPIVEVDTTAQVEAFYDPEIAQRMVETITGVADRTLLSGLLAGPGRALDRAVSALEGRVSLSILSGGGLRLAAQVRAEVELRESMRQLLAPFALAAASVEYRDGWVLVTSADTSAWDSPGRGESVTGPFLWIRFATASPDSVITVELRRSARDLVAVELRWEG